MNAVTLKSPALPIDLLARLGADRSRGLLVAIGFLAVLVLVVNVLSASALGYSDFMYLSAGGMTLALAAVGATIVILTGGFDLSVGAVVALVNVILAKYLSDRGLPPLVIAAAGITIGALIGSVNGFFVAVLRIQSIVVTLSTMFVLSGVTLLIMDTPGGTVEEAFTGFFTGAAIDGVLPAPVVTLSVVALVWLGVKRTRFGTALYAIGSDEESASFAGISVVRTKMLSYTLAGAAYGMGGVLVTAQTATGDPLVGAPLLLQAFTAVVLGGTALGGGRGGCIGSIVGAYSLMFIVNILLVLNVPAYFATIAEATVLLGAALAASSAKPNLWGWMRNAASLGRFVAQRSSVVHLTSPRTDVTATPWMTRHAEALRYVLPSYICLVLIVGATAISGRSVDLEYLNALLLLSSFLVVLALGQGTVILTGGLDLSIPWIIGLTGVLLGGLARGSDMAALWAVPLVLGLGLLIGVLNGAVIVLFKLPPIVVTLAMNGLLQGVALLYSNGTPDGFAPPALKWLMTARVGPFTPIVFAILIFVALGVLLLSRTVFGRHIYAVGNSSRVAHLSGVSVSRVLIGAYALSGLCAALVGVMLTAFGGQASLGMGDPYLLSSIAVVVIGGTLITGGRGKFIGMVGGVLLLTALQMLLAGTTVPPSIRDVIFGVVILCAVVTLRDRASH